MSRIFSSSFRPSTSPSKTTNTNLDNDPLLPLSSPSQRSNSISLQNLSPRVSLSPAASPSPPPSFYRSKSPNHTNSSMGRYADTSPRSETLSPSPSRMKGRGRGVVQFAGPPPPVAASVVLPRHAVSTSSRPGSSSLDGTFSRQTSSPQMHTVMRSRRGSGGASHLDPLLGLERRERAIQKELQELLDAQSAGLVQGFGGQDEGGSEAGSSTPTYNSTRSRSRGESGVKGGVVPVRQPKKKTISLRGARRGLLRDIGELGAIKGEEVNVLSESIAQREEVLRKVGVWEERISSFQKKLSSSSNADASPEDEEGRELAELRNEEKAVDNEIREMEDRLAQMRARRKWIQERVREGENRREAKLSSYRGALREVEGEAREFLRRPPTFIITNVGVNGEDVDGAEFMQLPVGRRTLGMAKELWSREISQIQTRRAGVEKEREALEEGAKIWEEGARAVMEFEDDLRKQMKGDMQDTKMLKVQVRKMGDVVRQLESSVRVAEEKGWNLLICALGAELEAFKEGEGILRGALGMAEGDDGLDGGYGGGGVVGEESGSGIEELNGVQDRGKSVEREESVESEDEGPNLEELLVDNSHGDGENSVD